MQLATKMLYAKWNNGNGLISFSAGVPNSAPMVPTSIDLPLLPTTVQPAQNALSQVEQANTYLSGAIQRLTGARISPIAISQPQQVPFAPLTALLSVPAGDDQKPILHQLSMITVIKTPA